LSFPFFLSSFFAEEGAEAKAGFPGLEYVTTLIGAKLGGGEETGGTGDADLTGAAGGALREMEVLVAR
jgi:hypothetical protein